MADRIKLNKARGTWVVRAGGAVIGESEDAIELVEDGHDPVIYFPRDDIAMAFLDRSDTTSHCPHKGDATYYAIQTESATIRDGAWSYEKPKKGMERIARHLAFQGSDDVKVEAL